MIKLVNVYKDYKLGKTKVKALRNINLSFASSGFVFVHGPSGCGKTTLLNIIGGLDKPTKGNLNLNNQDTINFKNSDWDSYRNQEVGFVFQNYYLLPQLNVYENVEFALDLINVSKDEKTNKVNKALSSVGLLDQAKKMPNQLSGGQIQRVAIARAIVNEPSIILADEPTGALDSGNANIIMDILAEVSKERLVILVSHNLELGKAYATRVIEMLDGEVINDSATKIILTDEKEHRKQKVSMSIFTSLKIGIRNLLRTKLRTPLIVFAGSIGIIGIGLVLSIAKGVNVYIEDVQRSALENNPITITSSPKRLDDSGEVEIPRERFPDVDEIYVTRGSSRSDFVNYMEDDFLIHMEELEDEYYSLIKYNRRINMNLISDNLRRTYTSSFFEMTDDIEFMREQFDELYGAFPTNDNTICASLLRTLDLDTEEDVLSFTDIIGKEYRVIDNNDFYDDLGDRFSSVSLFQNSEELYENADIKLKITAIIRNKRNNDGRVYNSGILYSRELTNTVHENNMNSLIVKEQLKHGLDKNVLTGNPFEEIISDSFTTSKIYQLESQLVSFGAIAVTSGIQIYTRNFSDRLEVKKHFDTYENQEANVTISFNDRLNNVVNEFAELTRVFSSVLIIFSSVSLVVSSIMIAIITYVSILQRTKEIGLLRSIGARKKDITRLFNVETILIGFLAGILGVIGVFILLNPVNSFVQNMVTEYTISIRGVDSVIVARFEPLYMLILVFGSMLLSLISGFIPAIMASRKSPIDALRNER